MRRTLAAITQNLTQAPEVRAEHVQFPGARSVGGPFVAVPSLAEIEESAYARGFAEGQRSAQTTIELAAVTHGQEIEAAIEAERARVLAGEAAALASKLTSVASHIEVRLVELITPVLKQVLEAAVVDRAIAELGRILSRAIASDAAFQISVTASQIMIDALKRHLPAGWDRASFSVEEGADIRVAVDDADMVVNLQEWRRAIEGAVL